MSVTSIIQLALLLLQGVLRSANQAGAADVAAAVSNAITELKKVQGTPVIKAQVDTLTVEKLW